MGNHERAWELFNLLNPVHHTSSAKQVAVYKVEPYVVAADVYGVAPHVGRGGWTWYTGSAGWMYRLLVETLLGVNREGDTLRLSPRFPKTWPSYKIHYRFHRSVYHITVNRIAEDSSEPNKLVVDGQEVRGETFPMHDDSREHFVELRTR